jgi:osmotically inducible protein OsmC
MAADKHASVHWEGAGKTGKGQISTETGALKDYPYGFASRFEDDKRGTNPEEIVGAAHAACLTMAFAFALEAAGLAATRIDTKAAVRLAKDGAGFKIDRIQLELDAAVPNLDEAKFQRGRRQGRLPAVEGARERARDHAEGDALQLTGCL